jgi:hypothetical protein
MAADETRFSTPIPISSGRLAFIDMPRPMTVAEWDQLLRVLDAMRPGLVAEADKIETEARRG